MQEAVAAGLEHAKEHNFFPQQIKEYAERRAVLLEAFDKLGMKYTVPEGSYFALLVSIDFLCRAYTLTKISGHIGGKVSRGLSVPRGRQGTRA